MDAGHAGASGRFDRLHETALAPFALKVVWRTGWVVYSPGSLRKGTP